MPSRRFIVAISAVMVLSALTPSASLAAPTPTARSIQDGLVIPWDLGFAPDGQMFVTERPGRVRVYASARPDAALLATTTISGVRAQGEAGVMGIAVDHAFANNRLVYVCASRTVNGQWVNQVIRYKVRSNWTLAFDRWIIRSGMVANTIHNGCAVEEGPDHKLWISMGDANEPWRAQHSTRLNGKILRVNRDGSVPGDNPIMPGVGRRTLVYSMGHRNPQGIAFQPGSGRVYAIEHGPDRDDEINRLIAGKNYGWPCVTGRNHSYLPGTAGCAGRLFTRPVWSSEGPTLATSNGVFLRSSSRWDTWTGDIMVTTLKQNDVRRFDVAAGGSPVTMVGTHYDGRWGRLRAAVLGPGYQLFLTTSNGSNDRVIRVTP